MNMLHFTSVVTQVNIDLNISYISMLHLVKRGGGNVLMQNDTVLYYFNAFLRWYCQ